MKLAPCIHQFFDQYLINIKAVSHHTLRAYRDSFKLFLPFAAEHYGIKMRSLTIEHITVPLIIAFLEQLQHERHNLPRTRNLRLATLKSFAKMIRLMSPQHRELAERIIHIPQKRFQKPLIGFLYQEEILKVFQSVDLRRKEGFRDYTLLHLLFDSGARASEITTLNLDYFNPQQKTLAILGKGNRFRILQLRKKTSRLLELYIRKYRISPKPRYQYRLFVNQRRQELTQPGLNRICKKYLTKALPPKRLSSIKPVHSFRHACAVDLLYRGKDITHIQNRLGHDNVQSTCIYLHLDLNHRRYIQKHLIRHMESDLPHDPKINELLQWESQENIMKWLDSL